ncbi:MAG TPA: hypothetical protein VGQ80_19120 [Acidimicrobiia bacterium]|nr:hypothetical protein [Acidimicrobiia bacterium]
MPGRSGGGLRFVPAEWGDASRGHHQPAAVLLPGGSTGGHHRKRSLGRATGRHHRKHSLGHATGRHDRARPVGRGRRRDGRLAGVPDHRTGAVRHSARFGPTAGFGATAAKRIDAAGPSRAGQSAAGESAARPVRASRPGSRQPAAGG